jgi:type I site-specific restriction-modification system R (restriction) subunit
VDFPTDDGVAIEVKKGKPNRTKLMEQINRYAQFEEVQAVIIVAETSLRIPIGRSDNGNPCSVVGLQKLWGIAL